MSAVLGEHAAVVDTISGQRPKDAGGGELNGIGAPEDRGRDGGLHNALAVCFSDSVSFGEENIGIGNGAVVDHAADETFGRGGGAAVGEDVNAAFVGKIVIVIISGGFKDFFFALFGIIGDGDGGIFVSRSLAEIACDIAEDIQVSAAVRAEIEDKILLPLFFENIHSGSKLVVCLTVELRKADISGLLVEREEILTFCKDVGIFAREDIRGVIGAIKDIIFDKRFL